MHKLKQQTKTKTDKNFPKYWKNYLQETKQIFKNIPLKISTDILICKHSYHKEYRVSAILLDFTIFFQLMQSFIVYYII